MANQELIKKIDSALDSIRPYLKSDGGDIKVVEVTDDMVAVVEFLGSCSSCKMSTMTFTAGVEEAIKKEVPEIKEIKALNLTALG